MSGQQVEQVKGVWGDAKTPSGHFALKIGILAALTVVGFFVSFMVGRYPIDPATVWSVILSQFTGETGDWEPNVETVVMTVRLPRICLAILIGGALSVSGSSYQTLFKNPMVSPDLLGVSAGAGLGAAIAMLYELPWYEVQALAFAGGILAVGITYFAGKTFGDGGVTVLVLSGVVVSAFFQALISVVKTLADPFDTLPNITYWLMGSLSKADNQDLAIMAGITVACLAVLFVIRNQVNTLAAGEAEASTMGVNVNLMKVLLIVTSTLMTVCAVSIAGIVGWVGLVIPHLARMFVGSDFSRLLPASFFMGALLLLVIDGVIRGPLGVDLPLGVLTALIGTPAFMVMLKRVRKVW